MAADQLWLGLCLVGSHSSAERWAAASPARCQERRAPAGWEQRGTAPCPSGWGQAPCAVLQHPRLWHRPRISPPFIPDVWWLRAASGLQAVGVPATKCGLPARGTCCRQVSKQQLKRPALVLQVIQQARGHRLLPAQPCPSSLQPAQDGDLGHSSEGGAGLFLTRACKTKICAQESFMSPPETSSSSVRAVSPLSSPLPCYPATFHTFRTLCSAPRPGPCAELPPPGQGAAQPRHTPARGSQGA